MRHINIPIFIPHLGCPHACVFCNQRKISGVQSFSLENVIESIDAVLTTVSEEDEVEIAFFGGSFTAIDRDLMVKLLEIGYSYIERGLVKALRCSTRPDAIDEEILSILKQYGIQTIELGMQSASDKVLCASARGHTFSETVASATMVKEAGFDLVLQMMLGLPCSTLDDELLTAREIVRLKADGARIYPTVVFYDTELCELAKRGEYTPLSVDEAVKRGCEVFRVLSENGVKVIRIGLSANESLTSSEAVYGGANHPALGELIYSEYYFEVLCDLLEKAEHKGEPVVVYVNKNELSRAIGHKKKNKMRLTEMFSLQDIRFLETELPDGILVSFAEM